MDAGGEITDTVFLAELFKEIFPYTTASIRNTLGKSTDDGYHDTTI
jgi:hypothetical protein